MFTGLIQGTGKLKPFEQDRFILSVFEDTHSIILSDLAIGDSVAVDGVCLTVEEILLDGFIATASPETLSRTTLGKRLAAAEWVNLETSLRVGSKIGGHFVTGHIDGVGSLVESFPTETSWEMIFTAPPTLTQEWEQFIARYIVSKGSIAVNGISLTVSDCDKSGSWFKVSVIPHTYDQTNLSYLKTGDWVNLEGDILGKYVERLLGKSASHQPHSEEVSLGFLAEHGYL
ncbi:riboflavin synthase [Aphanothece hegewaldii CCALA 016]|uniref:Riboflavin synthase n=1 Tax=Aphanothece hegewaldii CCALA 016 TaxID=2107694 RepID=A0A2T1M0X6_9CHRO|nr:riboflavin synthase [Aphanothece hegewaldii]PSF38325.1 riboflavin synthase [Aphanothece hegewaldii CCALA 016]